MKKIEDIRDLIGVIFEKYIGDVYVGCYTTHKSLSRPGVNHDDVLAGMSKIEYNQFDGKSVAEWITQQLEANDGEVSYIRFGREGSPVLYLTLSEGRYDEQKKEFVKYTAKELKEISNKLIEGAYGVLADEVWNESPLEIRLWWD